jgi:hypothetical protein
VDAAVPKSYNWAYIALSFGILAYNFTSRVVLLLVGDISLPSPLLKITIFIESRILQFRNMVPRNFIFRIIRVAGYNVIMSLYMVLVACSDLYGSKFWKVSGYVCVFIGITNHFSRSHG